MSEQRWTPGPWRVGWETGEGQGDHGEGYWIRQQGKNGEIVSNGGKDSWGVPIGVRTIANDHLIASAPELYEALAAIEDDASAGGYYGYAVSVELIHAIRPLLAKARGEQQ